MAESAVMRWSWGKAVLTSRTDEDGVREFRNRPGRDLLLALVISYLMLAVAALVLSQSMAALGSAALVAALVPVGLLLAMMKVDLNAGLGLVAVLALAAAFLIRMPGYVRVPLLVVIFAGAYYVTLQAGAVLD